MAPAKGTKRATTGAGSPKKKCRVDPMFAGIIATLQGAEDVSERCREMLIAFVSPSLSTPKSERHHVQQLGVSMIEETFETHKKQLSDAVELAQKELSDLEGSKNTLSSDLESAQASLEEKKAAYQSALNAHKEAKQALTAARTTLTAAKDSGKKADAKHVGLDKEKAALDAAHLEHYKTHVDANEVPNYSCLQPFIAQLGLEDSLASALPSSCAKAKDQRGHFDELVIGELGKALVAKIEALSNSIANEVIASSECKAAVASAEEALEAKVVEEKGAAVALELSLAAQTEAEATVQKASQDWATFEPRVQEATDKHNLEKTKLLDFVEGALKDFCNFRDKEAQAPEEPVEEEAAPAGA